MNDQNTKLVEQINKNMNTSTSAVDFDLLKSFLSIQNSNLTDGQKLNFLYFIYKELCAEIRKMKKTRERAEQIIDQNPSQKNIESRMLIQNTITEYSKIRELIGDILYDAFATDAATDDHVEAFDSFFLKGEDWAGNSNAARKVANTLRGFKIKK